MEDHPYVGNPNFGYKKDDVTNARIIPVLEIEKVQSSNTPNPDHQGNTCERCFNAQPTYIDEARKPCECGKVLKVKHVYENLEVNFENLTSTFAFPTVSYPDIFTFAPTRLQQPQRTCTQCLQAYTNRDGDKTYRLCNMNCLHYQPGNEENRFKMKGIGQNTDGDAQAESKYHKEHEAARAAASMAWEMVTNVEGQNMESKKKKKGKAKGGMKDGTVSTAQGQAVDDINRDFEVGMGIQDTNHKHAQAESFGNTNAYNSSGSSSFTENMSSQYYNTAPHTESSFNDPTISSTGPPTQNLASVPTEDLSFMAVIEKMPPNATREDMRAAVTAYFSSAAYHKSLQRHKQRFPESYNMVATPNPKVKHPGYNSPEPALAPAPAPAPAPTPTPTPTPTHAPTPTPTPTPVYDATQGYSFFMKDGKIRSRKVEGGERLYNHVPGLKHTQMMWEGLQPKNKNKVIGEADGDDNGGNGRDNGGRGGGGRGGGAAAAKGKK